MLELHHALELRDRDGGEGETGTQQVVAVLGPGALGAGHRDRQGLLQPGRLRDLLGSDADHGRHGLHRGDAGRVVLPQVPRLDDRRRLDRDPQEPHRRIRFRADVFTASFENGKA